MNKTLSILNAYCELEKILYKGYGHMRGHNRI